LVSDSPSSENGLLFDFQTGNYHTSLQRFKGNLQFAGLHSEIMVSRKKTDGHIDSSDFEGWNIEARFQHEIGKNWDISLEGRYVPYTFNDPFMGPDLADLNSYGKIKRGMLDIQLEGQAGSLKNSIHLYSNFGHHRFNDGFDSRDYSFGFSSYQSYTYSEKIKLSFGLDALRYGGKAKNSINPSAPPRSDPFYINSLGIYNVLFYTPNAYLTVKAGLRYQVTSLAIQKFSPTVGISFLPRPKMKIFANYNDGFRLPTIQELYLFPVSNENLDPETVNSYEVGSTVYFGAGKFIRVAYFRNSINNLIQQVFNPAPPPAQVFRNSGGAEQWGIETTLSMRLFPFVQGQMSYSYLDPDHLTAYNPGRMFKYYLNIDLAEFDISIFGKYIANLYSMNNREAKLDNYHLLNLVAAYPVEYVTFHIQIRNLFSAEYQVFPRYPAPQLNFLAGITLELNQSGR
jgi:iron complex outermembrane receptor protein